MPRIPSKKELLLKERICSQREQILPFKSSLYGKEVKYFMLKPLYYKYFLTQVTHMRYVRNCIFKSNQINFITLRFYINITTRGVMQDANTIFEHILCFPTRQSFVTIFILSIRTPLVITVFVINLEKSIFTTC